jgi:hypothetical protein
LETETAQAISDAAMLQLFVEGDKFDKNYWNLTLKEIKDEMIREGIVKKDEKGICTSDNKPLNYLFFNLPDDSPLMSYKLVSQSQKDGGHRNEADWEAINPALLSAAVFEDPDGNLLFTFRGTGDARWVDNGEGMTLPYTVMQRAALQYFDTFMQENLDTYANAQIDIVGHSKGGNSAQFVTMMSAYGGMIHAAYSLDGQGFSDAAVDMFKNGLGDGFEEYEKGLREGFKECDDGNNLPPATIDMLRNGLGDRYDEQIAKLTQVQGQLDYVGGLANSIIPESQWYFVETKTAHDFPDYHTLWYMLEDENGNNTNLNWITDEEGEIEHGQGDWLNTFANTLSNNIMSLPLEQRGACAISIMSILEFFMGTDDEGEIKGENSIIGLGNRQSADLSEIRTFLIDLIPVVLATAGGFEIELIKEKIPELMQLYDQTVIGGFRQAEGEAEDAIHSAFGDAKLDLKNDTANRLELLLDDIAKTIADLAGGDLSTAWKLTCVPTALTVIATGAIIGYVALDIFEDSSILICKAVKVVGEIVYKAAEYIVAAAAVTVLAALATNTLASAVVYYVRAQLLIAEIEYAQRLFEEAKKLCAAIENFVIKSVDAAKALLDSIKNRIRDEFNVGYRYASDNPFIQIDTYNMLALAGRLNKVNSQIYSVDLSMDRLYSRLCDDDELIDTARNLYHLVKADILTSYSLRLKACESYLTYTANAFADAEDAIVSRSPA